MITRRAATKATHVATGPLPLEKNILASFVSGRVPEVNTGRRRGRPPSGGKGRGKPSGAHGHGHASRAKLPPEAETLSQELSVEEREDDRQETEKGEQEHNYGEEDESEGEEGYEEEGRCADTSQGSTSSSSRSRRLYLRGQSKLPKRPIPEAQRPVLRPYADKSWEEVGVGAKECRPANGILGGLLKEHFPGMVKLPGDKHVLEPAYSWNHYKAKRDALGLTFAQRVKAAFWDFYKCEEGKDQEAEHVQEKVCMRLVQDMHYDARVQAVVTYYVDKKKEPMTRDQAKTKYLEKDQYMQVKPRWCENKGECWERMVDKWCSDEWMANHIDHQNRRKKMQGASHHQGNVNLLSYAKKVKKRTGVEYSEFEAYGMSHKAKASKVTPYNDSDPAEAYTSLTSYNNMTSYKEVFKEKHGAESDPTMHPLDPEVVMIAGEGKRHGRYLMGGSILSTASTPTLPQIKARQTSSSPAIRSRSTPIQLEIEARMAEERKVFEERLAEKDREMAEKDRVNKENLHALLAEERQKAVESMHHMLTAYCVSKGFPTPDRPSALSLNTSHPSGAGLNNPTSSHAGDDNPLGSSPHL